MMRTTARLSVKGAQGRVPAARLGTGMSAPRIRGEGSRPEECPTPYRWDICATTGRHAASPRIRGSPDQPGSFRATIAPIGPVGERLERGNRFVTTAQLEERDRPVPPGLGRKSPGRGVRKVAIPRVERLRVSPCLKWEVVRPKVFELSGMGGAGSEGVGAALEPCPCPRPARSWVPRTRPAQRA